MNSVSEEKGLVNTELNEYYRLFLNIRFSDQICQYQLKQFLTSPVHKE